ncbi:unnamed protein product [Linum trigynum]|uniref:Uncharacterized protein n=1 Tax=Linum trigynum TaxID=586398 RepID=A0AAV2FC29_9ROSI
MLNLPAVVCLQQNDADKLALVSCHRLHTTAPAPSQPPTCVAGHIRRVWPSRFPCHPVADRARKKNEEEGSCCLEKERDEIRLHFQNERGERQESYADG